jgi:hypothetical protein
MIALRQAIPEDDQALAVISFECWDESNDPGSLWARDRPFFGPPTDARVQDVIVATRDDQPIGYIRTLERSSEYGDWYIAGLGVTPVFSIGRGRSQPRSSCADEGRA